MGNDENRGVTPDQVKPDPHSADLEDPDDVDAATASIIESAPSSFNPNRTTALVQDEEDTSFKIQFEARATTKMSELAAATFAISTISMTILMLVGQLTAGQGGSGYSQLGSCIVAAIGCAVGFGIFTTVTVVSIWLLGKERTKQAIHLSQDGITFSSRGWKTALLGRTTRPWNDLHSVQLSYCGQIAWKDSAKQNRNALLPLHGTASRTKHVSDKISDKPGAVDTPLGPQLMFEFSSGGNARIDLNSLNEKQAEILFRGLGIWADTATYSADVVKLERAILLGQTSALQTLWQGEPNTTPLATSSVPSFTAIWQDDLNARYIATNYAPLQNNHVLQSGRYRVLLQLATGGMSSVYLCSCPGGERVVLKEAAAPLNADHAQSEKAKELFAREARLLLKLRHAQIAKVLDSFTESGRDYIALEYIPGQTIREIVRKSGRINEATALRWARDLCMILDYLHSQQPPILHRDLTPDNIILSENGRLVVVDFGAANEYLGNATGTFIGKQSYMAPEQVRGRATTLSDIYAVGATLYFMLAGCDPTPLYQSHPKEKAPETSDACDQLVAICTDFDQSGRPQSAPELATIIDSLSTVAAVPLN
jgi:tRNA A-37 threonylcarbamoyl transferase component Bud32